MNTVGELGSYTIDFGYKAPCAPNTFIPFVVIDGGGYYGRGKTLSEAIKNAFIKPATWTKIEYAKVYTGFVYFKQVDRIGTRTEDGFWDWPEDCIYQVHAFRKGKPVELS